MIDCGNHLATHPKTLEAVIRALEVPDKKHNPNAVNELSNWFTRISFFQDFMNHPELDENMENIIMKFSQCMQISREPAGKVLLRPGETMKRMYVVISGKVGVYANLNEEFISPEQAAELERIRIARLNNPEEDNTNNNNNNQVLGRDNAAKRSNTHEDYEGEQEQDIDAPTNEGILLQENQRTNNNSKPLKQQSQQLFQQMDVLCSGQHFGNLDLLYDHKSNCQIQTIDDCVLGYLEERFYFTYIKQYDEFRLHLLMLPLAKSFPVSSKNQIRMFFVNFFMLPFNKHQIVFAEHNKSNGFYLVKEGLFLSYQSRTIQEINAIMNKDERQQLIQAQISPATRKSNIFGETPQLPLTSTSSQPLPSASSPSLDHLQANPPALSSRISRHIIKTNQLDKKKIISLFSFAQGQIFGEDDLVKMRRRRYSLKCDSLDGLVYFMRKRDYSQLIYENPEIKYQFLSLANGKIKQLQHRMEQIKGNIDLMKAFAWEDRNKPIDDSQSSMIYLDMNNKPKSKLDLNEYLENQAEKTNRKGGGGIKRSASQLIGMTNGSSVAYVSSSNGNNGVNGLGNANNNNNGNSINTSQNNISKHNHMLTSQNSCASLSTPFRGNSPASMRLTPISPLKARCSSIQSTVTLNLNLQNINNNINDSPSNSPFRDRYNNNNNLQNNQNILNSSNSNSPGKASVSSHNLPEFTSANSNNPYGFSALLTLPQQQQQQQQQNQSSQTNFPSLKAFPYEFPPLLQLQSAAGNASSTNTNNNPSTTSSHTTQNQPSLQHFQSSQPSSPVRSTSQKHLHSQQRLSEPSLLLSQIPLLNLEKLSQDRLLSYSPTKSRRTYSNNYPSSQETTDRLDLPYSILGKARTNSKYIDDESNFCTTRQRLVKDPEQSQQLPKPTMPPANPKDLRKSTRDISSMVDSLVQSQKNLNYDGTLNYFLNFKNETNQRALNKQTINSHTFKFMHDLLHSERYKGKKDKVPVFSKNFPRNNSNNNKGEEESDFPATERNQFEQLQQQYAQPQLSSSSSQGPISSQSLPQYLQSEQRLSSMRINTHNDLNKEPSYDSSPAKFHLSPLKQTKYSDMSQRQSFQQAYQQQSSQGNSMLNGFIPSEPWTILQKPLRKSVQFQQPTHRRVTSNKLSIQEEPLKQAEI